MEKDEIKFMISVAVIALALLIGAGSIYLFGHDSIPEEVAEAVIHNETGLNVDLTPSSKENKEED